MLVVNVVFLISAVCSAANVATSINAGASTTKLKRVVVDPGRDTYNDQEQFDGAQSTERVSPPRDINSRSSPRYRNAKATDVRKVSYGNPNHGPGLHAYGSVPKQPFPYATTAIHQTESHQNSPLSPYFNILNNPVTYKAATSAGKPLDASKAIVSLQKLQGTYHSPAYNSLHRDKSIELSDFSDSDYPSYASISKIISQSFENDASAAQVPVYKTGYPLPKVAEYTRVYAPSFPTASSAATSLFRSAPSSDKTKQSSAKQTNDEADVNGKEISVPIVHGNRDLSAEVFPAFESQPFLLSASYPIESNLGFTYGDGPKFNMALQSRNASPFLSPLSSFQGHIVPIQTASGTPHFPQYKGASVEVYPVASNVPKARGSYESFYSQPQLHFGKAHGGQSANAQQNGGRPSTEDILEDAEVINRKNPEPHPSQTDDNDEEDERYKSPEMKYEHSYEDDDAERGPGMHFKEPPMESDFKPSTSFPFKEYDERFGKYTAHLDNEDDSEDKPYSSHKNHSSSNVDDEEEEDASSEYHAGNVESSRPSHASYEAEDEEGAAEEEEEVEEEEESRKEERREETAEGSYEVEPKQSKYYGKDFEQEFEESYRKELPKHKYVHVKEVPEVDSYNNPKSPRQSSKDDSRSRVNHESRSEESKTKQSRVSRKNRKIPQTSYRDSAAHSSDVFAKKAPKVIYEEFFGYRNPETGKYSKRAKTEIEKYSPAKKPSKEDNYLRAAKYYKFKSPKSDGAPASENKYEYYSAGDWKADKDSPVETAVLESSVRQLSDPGDTDSSYTRGAVSGVRSLTNAEILRDLTGI